MYKKESLTADPNLMQLCPDGAWITKFSGDGWNDYFDLVCPYCGATYEKDDGRIGFGGHCPNCKRKVIFAEE